MTKPKIAVLIPCYKRPEYTSRCIESVEKAQQYENTTFFLFDDNSGDHTWQILWEAKLFKYVQLFEKNQGLRKIVMDFFKQTEGFDYISKIDNDCIVPENWLNDIISAFKKSDVGVLSPNVMPSNAALRYGSDDKEGLGYRPSKTVGGVWTMRRSLIEGIFFEEFDTSGITGAYNLLHQIIIEKEPKIGWLENVTFQDLGHWSGDHPEHIKSEEHEEYSREVGRRIAWNA